MYTSVVVIQFILSFIIGVAFYFTSHLALTTNKAY